MMKRAALYVLVSVLCTPVWGGLADDGFLTTGEYVGSVTWRNYQTPLIVDGGGALEISVRDSGRLIVKSTSTPLQRYVSGVYDILLFNGSLLYLNGVTELIAINDNSVADLKGGNINYIKSMQYTNMTGADPHINLYCLPGWSWMDNNPLKGVQGQWWDGSPFSIRFINHTEFDPAWTNINFITPEPATLSLLALGGLLLRRKK
jgi:hypothetical protein